MTPYARKKFSQNEDGLNFNPQILESIEKILFSIFNKEKAQEKRKDIPKEVKTSILNPQIFIKDIIPERELYTNTGKIIMIISKHPEGLTKEGILQEFYENYETFSHDRKENTKKSLDKLIQRSRNIFHKYSLTIIYHRKEELYTLSKLT